tara:strand:+ start:21334 stop:24231 length:2898 start_codon:yes stop_codon:yes gene_type:complete
MPNQFVNINKKIQHGLNQRVKAMNSFGGDPLLRTLGDEIMNDPLGSVQDEGYELSMEQQMVKTPFARIISPGESSTEVLYGTFNHTFDQELGTSDESSGVDAFKSLGDSIKPSEQAYYNFDVDKKRDGMDFGKPRPGIESIAIDYQGYGGAIRKATIAINIFSLADLEKYTNNSILSIGRNLIVDWGWVRGSSSSEFQIPTLLNLEEDGKLSLRKSLFFPVVNAQTKKIEKPAEFRELPFDYYGDWGGLFGRVMSSTWSTNGSVFQCTVEVLAKGNNVFQKIMDNSKPNKQVYSMPSRPAENIDKYVEATTKDKDGSLDTRTHNIVERIKQLDMEILMKMFSDTKIGVFGNEWDEAIDIVNESGGEILVSECENIVMMVAPDPSSTVTPELLDTEGLSDTQIKFNAFSGLTKQIWIRWGWFEDNVVCYYAKSAILEKKTGNVMKEAEFRSIQEVNGELVSVKISNDEELYTHTPSAFVIPGQYKSEWFPTSEVSNQLKEDPATLYKQLADTFNGLKFQFAVDSKKQQGYLRNMYVNYNQIKSSFVSPGSSIESGMMKLANSLNTRLDFWDFEVESKELNTSCLLTVSIIEKDNVSEENEGLSEELDPKKSFIFDNYGMNSLIQETTLEMSVPDKFATSIGLGANTDSAIEGTDADSIAKYLKEQRSNDEGDEEDQYVRLAKMFNDSQNISEIQDKLENDNANQNPINIGELEIGPDPIVTEIVDSVKSKATTGGFDHNLQGFPIVSTEEQMQAELSKKIQAEVQKTSAVFEIGQKNGAINIDIGGTSVSISKVQGIGILDPTDSENKEFAKALPGQGYNYDSTGQLRQNALNYLKFMFEESPISRKKSDTYKLTLPLEVSITLDGCSGLTIGNMFRLSNIPEKPYNQYSLDPSTYFYVSGLQHNVQSTSWTTTITGKLDRVRNGELDPLSRITRENKVAIRQKLKEQFSKNLKRFLDLQSAEEED